MESDSTDIGSGRVNLGGKRAFNKGGVGMGFKLGSESLAVVG